MLTLFALVVTPQLVVAAALGWAARAARNRATRQRELADTARLAAAVGEERARIATELNSAIAARLRRVVARIEQLRAQLEKSPRCAPQVLTELHDEARQALVAMRRTLGLLRADRSAPDPAPAEPTAGRTLTLPPGAGPFTAVLLLTGSGPQDRDETLFGHKPFLLLADTLTRAGYAVLRVDDRGVGGSGGDLAAAGYDELVGDVLAGVAYLKGRSDVDPRRIGLLGHSEGGYLAPLAAQRSGDIGFVILMAGPAVPGEDVAVLQNRLLFEAMGQPPAQVDAQAAYIHELVGLLRARDYDGAIALARTRLSALAEELRLTPQQIEAAARSYSQPTMRALFTYDPGPALDALHIPVLALFGGKDRQVPAAQSEPALRQRLASHRDATIRTFPQLNHLMQPATTGTLDEYARIETTISPEVLDALTQWLRARYSPGSATVLPPAK